MILREVQQLLNNKLAGEMLRYDECVTYLDGAVDDINTALDTRYPTFSEFNPTQFPDYKKNLYTTVDPVTGEAIVNLEVRNVVYNNYDLFPDKYIRSVVIPGAAYKWYSVDEEGASVAPIFQQEYDTNRFLMLRDFADRVPPIFQANNTGAVRDPYFRDKYTTDSEIFGVF